MDIIGARNFFVGIIGKVEMIEIMGMPLYVIPGCDPESSAGIGRASKKHLHWIPIFMEMTVGVSQ